MICRLLFLFLAATAPALAQTVNWGGPSSVVGTVPYTITAVAPVNLTVLKNGYYFTSGYNYASGTTSDSAGQTVGFFASGQNNQTYYSGSKSVTITAGGAPSVWLDVPSSVQVGASFSVTINVSDSDGDLNSYGLRWQGNGLVGWWGPGSGSSASSTMSFTAPSSAGTMNFRGEVWDNNNHGVAGGWYGISVVKASQGSVSISPSSTWVYVGQSVSFSASGGSGSGSYSWGGQASGSGSSNTVTFYNEGSSSVSVYRQGDATYNDSNTATASITVYKYDQPSVSSSNATITMGSSFYPNFNGGAGSGSWQWYVPGYTGWMSGSWTPPGVGSYTFYVYKDGDSTYNASNSAGGYTLTVVKANQSSVTISPGSQSVAIGTTLTFNAGGGSGSGAYNWGGDASGTGSSKSVTFNTEGTRTVTLYRAGDSNYNDSTTASVTITVSKLSQSPSVAISPSSQSVTLGQSISFSASGGAGGGSYNWGGDASGTGGTKSVTFNTAGTRTVTVYRAGDSTYSASNTATATITVNDLLPQSSVTISPTSQTIVEGQSITFTAGGGTGSGAYTWGGDASGTGSSKSITFNTAGTRTVTVYRAGDGTYFDSNTAAASITVNGTSLPSFTTQPQNQTVNVGATVNINVAASGNPAPTYQWQRKPAGGSFGNLANGGSYSGVTTTTLTVSTVTGAMSGDEFRCVATNTMGSTNSSSAVLTVNSPPAITSQPQNQTGAVGGSVSFAVAASGAPMPTYQWQRQPVGGSFANLSPGGSYSGVTSANLSVSGLAVAMSGDLFRCVVTNVAGSATSSNATLTVTTSQNDTSNQNQLNIHLPISP